MYPNCISLMGLVVNAAGITDDNKCKYIIKINAHAIMNYDDFNITNMAQFDWTRLFKLICEKLGDDKTMCHPDSEFYTKSLIPVLKFLLNTEISKEQAKRAKLSILAKQYGSLFERLPLYFLDTNHYPWVESIFQSYINHQGNFSNNVAELITNLIIKPSNTEDLKKYFEIEEYLCFALGYYSRNRLPQNTEFYKLMMDELNNCEMLLGETVTQEMSGELFVSFAIILVALVEAWQMNPQEDIAALIKKFAGSLNKAEIRQGISNLSERNLYALLKLVRYHRLKCCDPLNDTLNDVNNFLIIMNNCHYNFNYPLTALYDNDSEKVKSDLSLLDRSIKILNKPVAIHPLQSLALGDHYPAAHIVSRYWLIELMRCVGDANIDITLVDDYLYSSNKDWMIDITVNGSGDAASFYSKLLFKFLLFTNFSVLIEKLVFEDFKILIKLHRYLNMYHEISLSEHQQSHLLEICSRYVEKFQDKTPAGFIHAVYLIYKFFECKDKSNTLFEKIFSDVPHAVADIIEFNTNKPFRELFEIYDFIKDKSCIHNQIDNLPWGTISNYKDKLSQGQAYVMLKLKRLPESLEKNDSYDFDLIISILRIVKNKEITCLSFMIKIAQYLWEKHNDEYHTVYNDLALSTVRDKNSDIAQLLHQFAVILLLVKILDESKELLSLNEFKDVKSICAFIINLMRDSNEKNREFVHLDSLDYLIRSYDRKSYPDFLALCAAYIIANRSAIERKSLTQPLLKFLNFLEGCDAVNSDKLRLTELRQGYLDLGSPALQCKGADYIAANELLLLADFIGPHPEMSCDALVTFCKLYGFDPTNSLLCVELPNCIDTNADNSFILFLTAYALTAQSCDFLNFMLEEKVFLPLKQDDCRLKVFNILSNDNPLAKLGNQERQKQLRIELYKTMLYFEDENLEKFANDDFIKIMFTTNGLDESVVLRLFSRFIQVNRSVLDMIEQNRESYGRYAAVLSAFLTYAKEDNINFNLNSISEPLHRIGFVLFILQFGRQGVQYVYNCFLEHGLYHGVERDCFEIVSFILSYFAQFISDDVDHESFLTLFVKLAILSKEANYIKQALHVFKQYHMSSRESMDNISYALTFSLDINLEGFDISGFMQTVDGETINEFDSRIGSLLQLFKIASKDKRIAELEASNIALQKQLAAMSELNQQQGQGAGKSNFFAPASSEQAAAGAAHSRLERSNSM